MLAVFLLIPFLLISFIESLQQKRFVTSGLFCISPRKGKDSIYDLSIEQSNLVHNSFFA